MSKSDPSAQRKERNKTIRWVVTIFLVTILVSGTISLLSDVLMEGSHIAVAFVILLVIILIGIIFDIVGMAVATADEKPFHSMAARKVPGAQEAIRLLRNAERVSSICNDVVGDICGIVSGSASAAVVAYVINMNPNLSSVLMSLVITAAVAALTVGGKAVGKSIAMKYSNYIIYNAARVLSILKFRSK